MVRKFIYDHLPIESSFSWTPTARSVLLDIESRYRLATFRNENRSLRRRSKWVFSSQVNEVEDLADNKHDDPYYKLRAERFRKYKESGYEYYFSKDYLRHALIHIAHSINDEKIRFGFLTLMYSLEDKATFVDIINLIMEVGFPTQDRGDGIAQSQLTDNIKMLIERQKLSISDMQKVLNVWGYKQGGHDLPMPGRQNLWGHIDLTEITGKFILGRLRGRGKGEIDKYLSNNDKELTEKDFEQARQLAGAELQGVSGEKGAFTIEEMRVLLGKMPDIEITTPNTFRELDDEHLRKVIRGIGIADVTTEDLNVFRGFLDKAHKEHTENNTENNTEIRSRRLSVSSIAALQYSKDVILADDKITIDEISKSLDLVEKTGFAKLALECSRGEFIPRSDIDKDTLQKLSDDSINPSRLPLTAAVKIYEARLANGQQYDHSEPVSYENVSAEFQAENLDLLQRLGRE